MLAAWCCTCVPMLTCCAPRQAHQGFTGSPDTDPSPTFAQVSSSMQIHSNQLVDYNQGGASPTLQPVSVTVITF